MIWVWRFVKVWRYLRETTGLCCQRNFLKWNWDQEVTHMVHSVHSNLSIWRFRKVITEESFDEWGTLSGKLTVDNVSKDAYFRGEFTQSFILLKIWPTDLWGIGRNKKIPSSVLLLLWPAEVRRKREDDSGQTGPALFAGKNKTELGIFFSADAPLKLKL